MDMAESFASTSLEVDFFSEQLKTFRKQKQQRPSLYLVRISVCLGDALLRHGDLLGAMQAYQDAASDCICLGCNDYSPPYSRVHRKIGFVFERRGLLTDAVEEYQASLYGRKSHKFHSSATCKNITSSNIMSETYECKWDIDSAETFFRLGCTLRRLCQFNEALCCLYLALKIWRTALGPHHENIMHSWQEIAIVQFSCGKPVEAEAALSEAKNICMQISVMSLVRTGNESYRIMNTGDELCKMDSMEFFAAAA